MVQQPSGTSSTPASIPLFRLRIDSFAAMLNLELAEHPVYDGLELQWFDDDAHGTGMLVFLSHRADGRVDYYQQPGLTLDRRHYAIGGGIGHWTVTELEVARLVVGEDGVDAEVRFTDRDGRTVEVSVDDRDGERRRPGRLLAPVGDAIKDPVSLLLVWLPRFDLVRVTHRQPVVRIDGQDVRLGQLPGRRLHRRHLIKVAAPVLTIEVNGPDDGDGIVAGDGEELVAVHGDHRAHLTIEPPAPDLATLADGEVASGRWTIGVDGVALTGGKWAAGRRGAIVRALVRVEDRWRPGAQPLLVRLVTTLVPVFRRWPTTYRWRTEVRADDPGSRSEGWERTGGSGGGSYRRATGS